MHHLFDPVKNEYRSIEAELSNPEIVSDTRKMAALGKRQAELREIMTAVEHYERVEREMQDNAELTNAQDTDPELKALAMESSIELSREQSVLEETLKRLLSPGIRTTARTSSSRSVLAQVETSPRSSRATSSVCMSAMPNRQDGRRAS